MKSIKPLSLANLALLLLVGSLVFSVRVAQGQEEVYFPSATSTDSFDPSTSSTPELVVAFTASAATSSWKVAPTSTDEIATSSPREMVAEPIIRVGVYKTDKKVIFVSPYSYRAESGGEVIGSLSENEVATLNYSEGVYSIVSNSIDATTTDFIRLVPDDISNYFTIVNLDRHLVTRSQMNFATFRGALEYRYSAKSAMPYVVNELLLENYVAGIAETSNGAPEEYIKALQIAARTYAYKQIATTTPTHLFDVFASTNDQLYLGYNFESFSPRIAFFTAGTRGLMVTYKDQPVTTYYFSRSNGHTKTKKGVPWLTSVSAKYDKGYRMLGHGYGMSNHDAVLRASKDKWNYDKILGYYYQKTEVEKMFD